MKDIFKKIFIIIIALISASLIVLLVSTILNYYLFGSFLISLSNVLVWILGGIVLISSSIIYFAWPKKEVKDAVGEANNNPLSLENEIKEDAHLLKRILKFFVSLAEMIIHIVKIPFVPSGFKVLEDYIKKMISEGFPDNQIKDKLLAVGWKEKDIDLIFLKIKDQIQSSQQKFEEKKWEKENVVFLKTKSAIARTRLIDLFRLAFRMFRVKKSRTVLTILGIGVSFGVILFLVSLGYGLQRHLLRQISSAEALRTLDVFSPNPEVLVLNNETGNRFLQIPNVEKISSIARVEGQIGLKNIVSEVVFMGVPDGFFETATLNFIDGQFFKDSRGNELVVSSFFSQLFNLNTKEFLNKEAFLTFQIPRRSDGEIVVDTVVEEKSFKIIGVVDDEVSNFVYVPFSLLDKLNLPSFGSIKVQVSSDKYLEEVRSKLLDEGFIVSTISDTIDQANKIFNALQVILALFGVTALIVAVIGMINTMTIALLERIQEIGIMKVIGALDKDIKNLFLLESLLIGLLGGISGLIIGFLGSQLFNFGINVLAGVLGGREINLFFYPIWFVVTIVIFASFVGVATGVFPARRASKMDPLQALRYK